MWISYNKTDWIVNQHLVHISTISGILVGQCSTCVFFHSERQKEVQVFCLWRWWNHCMGGWYDLSSLIGSQLPQASGNGVSPPHGETGAKFAGFAQFSEWWYPVYIHICTVCKSSVWVLRRTCPNWNHIQHRLRKYEFIRPLPWVQVQLLCSMLKLRFDAVKRCSFSRPAAERCSEAWRDSNTTDCFLWIWVHESKSKIYSSCPINETPYWSLLGHYTWSHYHPQVTCPSWLPPDWQKAPASHVHNWIRQDYYVHLHWLRHINILRPSPGAIELRLITL